MFADIFEANRDYAARFPTTKFADLTGQAVKGIAIVTCIDSRIDPLGITGLRPGDAKILRNAGARVSTDVLRTLALASFLLGVNRALIMPHTDCRMASVTEDAIHARIAREFDVDTRSLEFRTTADQMSALASDVQRVRSFPLLAPGLTVGAAIYDVRSGRLQPVDL